MGDTSRLPVGGSKRINFGYDGANWAQNYQVVHTGDTDETELARILLPGGFLGPNGELDIHLAFTNNNSANDKTIKVKFGNTSDDPTTLLTHINTTDTFDFGHVYLTNRNSVDAQISIISDFNIIPAGITNGLTFDTESECVLIVTGQLENGSDNIALEIVHAITTYRD